MKVLGIPLYDRGMDAAIKEVTEICLGNNEKSNRCISATGAHGLITARKDETFAGILKGFYMNLPDGKPGAVVGRLKGAKEMKQVTGPDFFGELIRKSAGLNIRHYFCGGKEGVAEELKKSCEANFGNRNVVGCFSPPFRKMEDSELEELGNNINRSGCDVLWIGLSTPKQEYFAMSLLPYLNVHFIVTVGAAFDFYSGNLKKAPAWITRIGMEWFYRLAKEPKRLWKRYFEIVPKFMFHAGIELITGRDRQ